MRVFFMFLFICSPGGREAGGKRLNEDLTLESLQVWPNPSSRREGQQTLASGTTGRNNLTTFPLLAYSTCPNLSRGLFALTQHTRTTPTTQESPAPIGRLRKHRLLSGCPLTKLLGDWFLAGYFDLVWLSWHASEMKR
ncbi:hypothetical protein E2C01_081191 [Portunus trituberculatus]|uniref:Secreted protein n=1 Tax=Portunus trituberculatus TaxID=210409 RepID=A0A5B7IXB3_PORTR|nr:hypothetical protein [Portunus trituberculatus]